MVEEEFSGDKVQRAIETSRTAVLATINPDGSPLATPMWFVPDRNGIGMVSVDGLQKIHNLRRDPRVSVVVETDASGGPQCVIIQGTVEFLDSAADRSTLGAAFVTRYGEEIANRWGGSAVPPDRVLFRILPRRVKLWG